MAPEYALHGHWRLCQFLIESGADVNERAPETDETPLHSALTHPNPAFDKVVEVLVANGADPNAVTKVGVATGAKYLMNEIQEVCSRPQPRQETGCA